MDRPRALSLLQKIDGYFGCHIATGKYVDENKKSVWLDEFEKMDLNLALRTIERMKDEAELEKDYKVTMPKFKALYKRFAPTRKIEYQTGKECDRCRKGWATVVYAGDSMGRQKLVNASTGMCQRIMPIDGKGLYRYYSFQRQPCACCETGKKINDMYYQYDQEKFTKISLSSFRDEVDAADHFLNKQKWAIPFFERFVNNGQ